MLEIDSVVLQDVFEWDVRNWSKALPFWRDYLSKHGVVPDQSNALLLGERGGGLSLWFGLMGYNVVCSDVDGLGSECLELHRKYGVTKNMKYGAVDIKHIPYPDESFTVVACKSVIGGVKRIRRNPATRTLAIQKAAVEEMRRVLQPGGIFLGAENLRGSAVHRAARYVVKRGKVGWRHLSIEELSFLFDGFDDCILRPYGFFGSRSTIPGLAVLGDYANRAICPFLAHRWLYIGFIAVRKRSR